MELAIIAFDNFTDIDVFLLWDLLNRVQAPDWRVRILGEATHHTSKAGLTIPMHGSVDEARHADVVLFSSGKATRLKSKDPAYLDRFQLNPERQMIGSMCSGALILAGLGLLEGKTATTYPTTRKLLEGFGVTVVEKPFVAEGNIATAAGCLAGQYLAGWAIERKAGKSIRDAVLRSVAPVGEGLSLADTDIEEKFSPYAAETCRA